MKQYLALFLAVGSLLAASSGCQQENAEADTGEPWKFYAHGDPRVTLHRWARVGMDDEDHVYFVDFHAEKLVRDENLFIVRDLKHLKMLDLSGTEVTNFGLKSLRGLFLLEVLRLPDGISDEGLHNLRRLTNLREVYISPESGVTSVGVDQLEEWFPDAKIHFRQIFSL